jgi:DDE family transposase
MGRAKPTRLTKLEAGSKAYCHLGLCASKRDAHTASRKWLRIQFSISASQPLAVRAWLASLSQRTTRRERRVRICTPQGDFDLRLIAQRLPPEAVAAARQRAQQTSRKNGTRPNALAAVMAGWVVVVSNLPAVTWPAASVLALYRVRWQVELLLKRCKTLIHLDHLRCKDPELAQVYRLG